MRNGFLASLPGLLVAASLVLGQPPQSPVLEAPPVPSPYPLPQAGGEDRLRGESESLPAPAEATETGPRAPQPDILDGLASHLAGTCGIAKGNILTADLDYLLWVLKNVPVPVTLASTNALGTTGNQILIGQHPLPYHHRPSSGFRMSLAYWQEDPQPEFDWDKPRTAAIEANYLVLGERGIKMRNDTASVLIRPFFALNNRTETGAVVAAPGIANGGIVASANYSVWGGEVNFWKNLYYEYPGKTIRLDVLAGFRYLDLGEDLSVTSLSTYNQQPVGVFATFGGSQILVNDLFFTRNQFYGGQIGGVAKFFLDTVDLNIAFKIALGDTAEQVHIDGFQFRTFPNGTVVQSRGGLLALPSNIGRFRTDQFSVVPEVDVIGSFPICRHVSLTAGYTFISWNKVLRPGNQIDRSIDVTQIPNFPSLGAVPTGLARPSVPLRPSDFWAQGLTVGLQFVW